MARMARVVVPFYPHHITQRGKKWAGAEIFCASSQHNGPGTIHSGDGSPTRKKGSEPLNQV